MISGRCRGRVAKYALGVHTLPYIVHVPENDIFPITDNILCPCVRVESGTCPEIGICAVAENV